ncbi:serine/threonine protein kinase [Candidatus Burkholderia humilis]|nr:serine/threonine protein kinase [Candidatus Burkholderia humilis]
MESNGENLSREQFARAVRDLELITRQIAARYIEQDVPLTWRLLHAIETEAVADLGFAGRHEAALRELFAWPDDFHFPETDDVVDVALSDALPAVFAFPADAYEQAARHGRPQLAVAH